MILLHLVFDKESLFMSKTFELRAFSILELMISLVIISCVIAAFSPILTKKFKNSSLAKSNVNEDNPLSPPPLGM